MNKILTIGFGLIVLAHVLRAPIAYVYYYLDTEGFIEKLCENKEKVALQCNGKCFLAKMIAENEAPAEEIPLVAWEKLNLIFDSCFGFKWVIPAVKPKNSFFYIEPQGFHQKTKIFHPPKQLLTSFQEAAM
jgi:hypothetical protein